MTNTIKASEVRPGMEVQFDLSGWDVKGTVATVDVRPHAVWIYTEKWCEMSLDLDSPVTVLAEPQPEEPTAFGARVVVGGLCFVRRGAAHLRPWENDAATVFNWREVTRLGEVTVIDADPYWTAPEDAPETPVVPGRVEEWPENDDHLREQRWRDREGAVWSSRDGQWGYHSFTMGWVGLVANRYPFDGPWVRVP